MNDDILIQRLKQADAGPAPGPFDPEQLAVAVRRQYKRRQQFRRIAAASCAVCLVVGILAGVNFRQTRQKQQQVAALQQQIDQLTQRTDAAVKLVNDLLDRQQQADRLVSLHRRLAAYADPVQSVHTQVTEAAAVLEYRAERRQQQADPAGAAQTWQQIIDRFPQTDAARTARQRLQAIQQSQPDQI